MKSLFAILTSLAIAGAAFAADPVNEKCPVSGKAVDKTATAAYKKEVSFCCEKCKAKFDKDADSFADKIAKYDAASGKCILTGKAVDKEQKSTYERTVGFCCGNCPAKFEKEPDKYIVKAVKK